MKKIILTLNVILIGILATAQPVSIENLKQAKIEFQTEIIDYGTIEQNADGIREFKFKNIGTAPLIISDAKKSCGCTVPTWPKAPIKPGESSSIKVKYDTKRIGTINKSVILISNAERNSIILRIKGKVLSPQITPIANKKGKPVAN
jgi:hypothetical protein